MWVSYSFQQPQSNASQWFWRCSGFCFFNLDAGYLTGMFNLWKSPHMSNSSVGTCCSLTHEKSPCSPSYHLFSFTSGHSLQSSRLLSTPWPHQAISHLNLHADWISSFSSMRGCVILITQGLTSDDTPSEKSFLPSLAGLYYTTWSVPPPPHPEILLYL